MATTCIITGRVLLPDNTAPVDGVLRLVLSGVDTDAGEVIAQDSREWALEVDGDLPSGLEVYNNAEGIRATFYRAYLLHSTPDPFGVASVRREVYLGGFRIEDGDASETLQFLLDRSVIEILAAEAGFVVANTESIRSAGALMDDELANVAAVKGINQNLTTTSNVTFASVSTTTVASSQNLTLSADIENNDAASAINFNVDGTEVADFTNAGYLRFNKVGFGGGGICNQQTDYALNLGGGNNAINSGVNLSVSGPSHVSAAAGFQWRDDTTVLGGWSRSSGDHYWYSSGLISMTLDGPTGNLGIGIQNPTAKLHVNGSILATNLYKIPKTQVFTSLGGSVVVTAAPINKDHIELYFDGIFQDPTEYSLSGSTITFTGGTPSGVTKALVRYWHY